MSYLHTERPLKPAERTMLKTKYMTFSKVGNKPKTTVWQVVNNESSFVLGVIHWYGPWRQYVIDISAGTMFNNGCLETLRQFITELNEEQRNAR